MGVIIDNVRSAVLVQVQVAQDQAFVASPHLDCIVLAIMGEKVSFEQVVAVVCEKGGGCDMEG